MRTILAAVIVMVAVPVFGQGLGYSTKALTSESGVNGGGMFAVPFSPNSVRAGWGGPTVPFRVCLVRVTEQQNNPFVIVQNFTPTATSGAISFGGVAPGKYYVALALTPSSWSVASEVVIVK